MRTGVSLSVTPADLDRLYGLVKDRNAPQKHVWRAQIVLLSAEGLGTNAIMRETCKSKTCVWRWLSGAILAGSASKRVLTGLLDRLLRGRYPAGCKQNRGCLWGRAFVF
jgi:hypothetical protein